MSMRNATVCGHGGGLDGLDGLDGLWLVFLASLIVGDLGVPAKLAGRQYRIDRSPFV